MRIEFTARRVRLHPLLRDTVEKKLSRLERVLPRNLKAHVVVQGGKKEVAVEISLMGRSRRWTATANGRDQRTAAQGALDRLAAQAKKTKGQVKERKKHAVSAVRSPVAWRQTGPPPEPERRPAARGVQREPVALRAMFEEDAVTSLSGSGEDLLVFRDAGEGDAVRVLYRRPDGGLTLLVPE